MIYIFGDHVLDTERYELSQQGRLCSLEPQGFNVLVYLVQHRGRVVSKDELLEQLWTNQSVSESTLSQRLKAVRRALGDSGRTQRFVKTVHGRGYRFIADVVEHDHSEDVPLGQELTQTGPGLSARTCATCQHVNGSHAQFCNACGAPLVTRCPTCGGNNPPGAAFCHTCAASLNNAPSLSDMTSDDSRLPAFDLTVPSPDLPLPREAERRQLTVVYCSLVDATHLSEQLDLESYRDIVQAYQVTCVKVAQHYNGYVAQNHGEALLIYFGWPTAHEDDTRQAVRAGLEMLEAMETLRHHTAKAEAGQLAIRVAIHTGVVVVGEMGTSSRPDALALGATPNVATRLERCARVNTIVLSAATYELVQGYFAMEDLGPQSLKGLSSPIRVYQVIRESGAQHRFEVAIRRGLTPFVGCEAEAALLNERWQHAMQGMGHAMLISGEAGIGKTRLVQVLKERLAQEPYILLECRCSPYHRHSALYPFVDLFERTADFDRRDTATEKLAKLHAVLDPLHLDCKAPVQLIASLLSLPLSDPEMLLHMAPQQQRQELLAAVLTTLVALSGQQPVLLVVEDLHWVDPSTLDLLELLIEQVPTLPLFVVFTSRPTFDPPWRPHTYLTPIMLSRLSRDQVEPMLMHAAGGKSLPPEVVDYVVTQTDGIPLFIEELVKTVLESELLREAEDAYALIGSLSAMSIPTTLHDSLTARLDRLGTAKGMAQWGATIGRSFSYEILEAVSHRDSAALQRDLKQLVGAELLYQRGLPPQATYVFKHALVQEAAYQSLLRSTQQYYHQRIAQVLIGTQFAYIAETQPEFVAHHYTEAGFLNQAVVFWLRAGQQALNRSAFVESISHFRKVLELLRDLTETPERAEQELTACVALGTSIIATEGWSAPEVEIAYSRARVLCQQIENHPQLFSILVGLWGFYIVRAEYGTTCQLGEQLLRLAQQDQDLAGGHMMLGLALYCTAELRSSQTHFQQSLDLYDRVPQPLQFSHPGLVHPVLFCRSMASHTLWLLGYPDAARMQSHLALTLKQTLSQPFSQAVALAYAAMLHQCCQESSLALEYAEATLTVSKEHGLVYYLAWAMLIKGRELVMQGQLEAGLAQIQQGLEDLRALGGRLRLTYYLTLLAETYRQRGEIKEGFRQLETALVEAEDTKEQYWVAELYRLKGEFLLLGTPVLVEAAESCFHQALDVAHCQYAKSLELRAAMSLTRLWQQQDKHQEAYDLLAPIYGWFTEGFDTVDLKDAKALLDELA